MSLERFATWASSAGLELSENQLEACGRFLEELYRVNEVMNLTRVPAEEAWRRHLVDSLLFHDLFPPGVRVLDVGTGPGFPAWPLALARPDLDVTALDSNQKMLGFLRTQQLPNLRIVDARAEEWKSQKRFGIVTGRALAPLAVQIEVSSANCAVKGAVMPLRTPTDDFEASHVEVLGLRLETVVTRTLPETDIERSVPIYRKFAPTPSKYPRRWAEIKAKPL